MQPGTRLIFFGLAMLLAFLPERGYAVTPTEPPKPLLIVPDAPAAPVNPDDPTRINPQMGMPQMFVDEQKRIATDFNELMKEYKGIEFECRQATTPVAHTECDQKKDKWQAKMELIHDRSRNVARRIAFWRRKAAGLPPPEWLVPPKNKNPSNTGGNSSQPGDAGDSVLVPQQLNSAVPKNLFGPSGE